MTLLDTKPWAEVHSPLGAQTCPNFISAPFHPYIRFWCSILRDKGQHPRVYSLARCVKSD
jgi:hypothetical protein